MEKITLYFRQGASDKVYQAAIHQDTGGCKVQFAYGRRGATLTTGSKTSSPVPYDEAKRIFDKLIREKTAKGYTAGDEGTNYQERLGDRSNTGIHCQLLNPIEESQVDRLIADPAFWAQEKHDGRRLLLQRHDGVVTGINKLGFPVSVPEPIAEAARVFKEDFLIDGEAIGDVLHVFDLLSIGGRRVGDSGYAERNLHLLNLLASGHQQQIRMVQSAFLHQEKRRLFGGLKTLRMEGIVFKRFDAPYEAGRPASGGTQFKFKFCASASCLVGKINTKRSVRMELFDGDRLVSVGNVSIPANHKIPAVGSVIESRYLYAFPGGSLFQPVYQGPRDDIAPGECVVSQLKYRQEEVAA